MATSVLFQGKTACLDGPNFRDSRVEELLGSAQRQLEILVGIVESLTQEHCRQKGTAAPPCLRAGKADEDLCQVSLKMSKGDLSKESTVRCHPDSPPTSEPADPERAPSALSLLDERTELTVSDAQVCCSTVLLSAPERAEELLKQCIEGTKEEVTLLLESRADPNTNFGNFEIFNKNFTSGTPLAIAVLRDSAELAELLIAAGADPESRYSFNAGAEQVCWSGSAINAALPSGNLRMMEALVEMRADLHARASNGANLLWQAAYFGKAAIAKYLLASRVDLKQSALSQDDSSLSYTPLHVAAYAGHASLVNLLIEAKGFIHANNGKGVRPLDDALLYGHDEVARLLVESHGDLFRHLSFSQMKNHSTLAFLETKSERRGTEARQRCIEIIFARDNQNLTLAVARGLRKAPSLVHHLAKEDVVRFLRTPGETPMEIIKALFQLCHVRYWAESKSYKQRRQLNECYIDKTTKMNVARGPDYDALSQLFNDKRVLSECMTKFLFDIGPDRPKVGCTLFAPVDTYVCLLPLLHEDLDILRAIAENPRDDIFNDRGCQAIVHLKWEQERFAALVRMATAFIEVMNLVLINALLNFGQLGKGLCVFANVLALVVWIAVLSVEVAQCIGYSAHGLARRYFTSPEQWFDIIVLALTCSVIVMTHLLDCDDTSAGVHPVIVNATSPGASVSSSCALMPVYRTTLGIIVFVKWMRFLHALSSLESVGLRVLPITTAIFDIGPFCAVLTVYLIGACNMYLALGRQNFIDSILIVYRLVVMGDVNLPEMEGLSEVKQNTHSMADVKVTDYHFVVRVMMLAISFLLGVAMMNIFIAMLCLSYSEATGSAWLRLMRMRAHVVLDHQSMRLGIQYLWQRLSAGHPRRRNSVGQELSVFQVSRGGASGRTTDVMNTGYLWFSCQKSQAYL